MTTFFSASRRASALTVTAIAIAVFALAFAGCGDDDKTTNAGGPSAAAGTGGDGQGSGGGSGEKSGDGSGGSSPKSGGSGGGSGNGSGNGSESNSSDDSDGDSNSKKRRPSGPVIKDNNSFDSPAEAKEPSKSLSNGQSSGLGVALGQADGAADEYIGEALAAGRFKTDSRGIDDAMADAELAAPYIQRKLLVAAGSIKSGQAGTLRTDLTAAYATFEALKQLRKTTAGRRVARALGTLDAAIDAARKAGVSIDRSVPSRSELKRFR